MPRYILSSNSGLPTSECLTGGDRDGCTIDSDILDLLTKGYYQIKRKAKYIENFSDHLIKLRTIGAEGKTCIITFNVEHLIGLDYKMPRNNNFMIQKRNCIISKLNTILLHVKNRKGCTEVILNIQECYASLYLYLIRDLIFGTNRGQPTKLICQNLFEIDPLKTVVAGRSWNSSCFFTMYFSESTDADIPTKLNSAIENNIGTDLENYEEPLSEIIRNSQFPKNVSFQDDIQYLPAYPVDMYSTGILPEGNNQLMTVGSEIILCKGILCNINDYGYYNMHFSKNSSIDHLPPFLNFILDDEENRVMQIYGFDQDNDDEYCEMVPHIIHSHKIIQKYFGDSLGNKYRNISRDIVISGDMNCRINLSDNSNLTFSAKIDGDIFRSEIVTGNNTVSLGNSNEWDVDHIMLIRRNT